MNNPTLLLCTIGICLLASCKTTTATTITATETGESGPGAQTIKGGNVTFALSADAKPLAYTIGNGPNLLRRDNTGPGFYLIGEKAMLGHKIGLYPPCRRTES